MVSPACPEHVKMILYYQHKYKMQGIKITLVIDIYELYFFHVVEEIIEKWSTAGEKISPQAFNSLIVYTSFDNSIVSVGPTLRVLKHKLGNLDVLTASVHPNSRWQAILISCTKKGPKDGIG